MKVAFIHVRARSQRAFSLIELTCVLAVIAILLGVGVPGLRTMVHKHRLTCAVNELFTAINLARSEALQRGTRVDLVPADGRDWAKGWVVFVDKNNNQHADPGESVIVSRGPLASGLTIRAVFTDSSKQYLAYNGSGRTRTNASSATPQLGTISFFLDKHTRRIKLNFLGRARACNPDEDASCTGSSEAS